MKTTFKMLMLKPRGSITQTPAAITATSGSGQSATCGSAYTAPLVATVTTAGGVGVAGVAVTFAAPASGASGTFASTSTNTETVTTNASGVATSSTFTAGAIGTEGAFTVTATTGALSCNFSLTNLVLYILRDEFTTAESAPIASPHICVPGPGTLTPTQTGGQFSTSSGKLNIPSQGASPDWTKLGLVDVAGVARATGLALIIQFNVGTAGTQGAFFAVWASANSLNYSGFHNMAQSFFTSTSNVTTTYVYKDGGSLVSANLATNTNYTVALICRSSGAFWFIIGGAYSTWTLVWADSITNTTPVYPALSSWDDVATLDFIHVRQLATPFTTNFGIATVNQTNPANGANYTGTADHITDVTVTAPSPLADSGGMQTRVDALGTTYWNTYLNSAGAFRVDSVNAGSATNRVNVAAVATAGNSYTLREIAVGSLHDFWSLSGTTWTKRGTQINLSLSNTNATINATYTSYTATALTSYPRTASAYDTELNKT